MASLSWKSLASAAAFARRHNQPWRWGGSRGDVILTQSNADSPLSLSVILETQDRTQLDSYYRVLESSGAVALEKGTSIRFYFPAPEPVSSAEDCLLLASKLEKFAIGGGGRIPAADRQTLVFISDLLSEQDCSLPKALETFVSLWNDTENWTKDGLFSQNGAFLPRSLEDHFLLKEVRRILADPQFVASEFVASLRAGTRSQEALLIVQGLRRYAWEGRLNAANSPFACLPSALGLPARQNFVHRLLAECSLLYPERIDRVAIPERISEYQKTPLSQPNGHSSQVQQYRALQRRRTFRGAHAYAIDPARATEIDDAISIERDKSRRAAWFHVHVADVASWIDLDDGESGAAIRRATSWFLPEGTVPLLPWQLTEAASLATEAEDRWSVTFSFRVGEDSNDIADWKVTPSMLDSAPHPLTYQAASEQISSGKDSDLCSMFEAAKKLRSCRRLKGAIPDSVLSIPGCNAVYEGGEISFEPQIDAESPAQQLVSEFMITAGRIASSFAAEHRFAIPFRGQKPTDLPVPTENSNLAEIFHFVSSGFSAEYSLAPNRHFSLGLDAYSRVTSPIRRFADQIFLQQLKAVSLGRRPNPIEQPLLHSLQEGEVRAKAFCKRANRLFKLLHLQRNKDSLLEGTVLATDSVSNSFLVHLHGVDLCTKQYNRDFFSLAPGSRVSFRLRESDPVRGILILDLQGRLL